MRVLSNRNSASIARATTRMISHVRDERKARTKTLIQVGGNVSIADLLEPFGIQEGDDLQFDPESYAKGATLLGFLDYASEHLLEADDPQQMERFKQRGITLLRKRAAQKVYHNTRQIW